MILYHGSLDKVVVPVLNKSKKNNDFGQGFYLTSSKEQAIKWAQRNMNIYNKNIAYVSCFELNDFNGLRILEFKTPNLEWLEFIIRNRKKELVEIDADIVVGPVANDQVYNTIILFEENIISSSMAIKKLLTQKLFDQYLFKTENALNKLKFLCCFEVVL